jgi:hypothetical protein
MKTWTRDNRRLVWTANDTNGNRYDIYQDGKIVGENLDFDAFWILWKKLNNR